MKTKIKTIAFDADDTLWVNETYFQEAEHAFGSLMRDFAEQKEVSEILLSTELKNLPLYGYGVKGFVLCMIETANTISKGTVLGARMGQIIDIGQELLDKPIELLEGVHDSLDQLYGRYRLVLATKGDLLDQQRKLEKSGLENYFQHIEIMSDKQLGDYEKLLQKLDCKADNFLMLGNSLRSDVLPVLELGGYAGYIPFRVTWAHEQQHDKRSSFDTVKAMELSKLNEIVPYLI